MKRLGEIVGGVPNITNASHFGTMDNLTYVYDSGNKLQIVSDNANDTYGFKDDYVSSSLDTTTDYTYDANGNMQTDTNKGITAISYNHLNLPTSVSLGGGTINYYYDATGVKQRKVAAGITTDYAGGFQYEGSVLKFFSQPEGYVAYNGGVFSYIYQYKDHLGNIRLSYGDSNNNGVVNSAEIIEESNYYPFGLKHKGYNSVVTSSNPGQKKLFQGQERQDELGLNWDSFKWRNYDMAIGRFMSVDPLAQKYTYQSPYAFAENKVISHIELEGLEGLHHTLVDKAGNKSHVIEKNVIFLRQSTKEIPENATPKEIAKINRQNEKILKNDNQRITNIKKELSSFYGGTHQNSTGEDVTFKMNYSEISTNNPQAKGAIVDNKNLLRVSMEQGLVSSETEISGAFKIAPAAVFTTDTKIGGGVFGLTTANRKVFANSFDAPYGTSAHEFVHTLGVKDNGYTSGGILNSPPSSIISTEIDQIIKASYSK